MKPFYRLLASLALFSCVFGSAAFAADALEARVDAAVNAIMAEHKNAGVAVGVMRDGHMVLAKGYGFANFEDNVPVAADTVFRVGSITKQFTATAILMLAEEHKLSVDDKLSNFFPDFPRGDEVSVRNLLTHTSGIHNYTDSKSGIDMHKDMTTQEMVHNIQAQIPLYDFDPGTQYKYSNSGFFLLGAIVEKLSGEPLAAYFKQHIFDKVGLSATALDNVADIVRNRAAGYDVAADAPSGFHNTAYASMTWPGGAGAVRSTVGDLAKWHEALFGGKVLKPESLKEMTTPGKLKNGTVLDTAPAKPPANGAPVEHGGYGFGLFIGTFNGAPRIGHSGSINGFNAELKTFPQAKTTIVVLSNSPGNAGRLETAVSHAVLDKAAPTQ